MQLLYSFTIFPFLGNVLSLLSWNVHFKWSEQEFIQMSLSGQGPGRTSPSQDIPKNPPRIHYPLPPPGNRLSSNQSTQKSHWLQRYRKKNGVSKESSREWKFYKIECYHFSDDRKKKQFFLSVCIELSLHLLPGLWTRSAVCSLYFVLTVFLIRELLKWLNITR